MNIREISKQLKSGLEARMLVSHITGLGDVDLIGADDIPLTAEQTAQLNDYIVQRLEGRPVAKIIGRKEFYGRDFFVNDDVLDPRPDSETLIEVVLNAIDDRQKPYRILEMGVGSGCLILTLLSELPNATAVASDISCKALIVANRNALDLGVVDRIDFVESNWFDAIDGQFDIIISNPPYIESADIPVLDKDVRAYDPLLALDGGDDGLDPYRVILPQIRTFLNKGGFMAFEHGVGQSASVAEIMENQGFDGIGTANDLGGRDRVTYAYV